MAQYDFAWKECDSLLLYRGHDGAITLRPSWVESQQVVTVADLMTARHQVHRQIEAAMLSRYSGLDADAVFEQINARSIAAAEREHGQTAP